MFKSAAARIVTAVALVVWSAATVAAQAPVPPPVAPRAPVASQAAAPGAPVTPSVTPPPGYVIGVDDVLQVLFWRDKDMSAEVTVRPDGKITLLLVNEIQATGLTPEELQKNITAVYVAGKYFDDPTISVNVKEIRSRKVYITGQVSKPGSYPLTDQMTVLQLITIAGGLGEYAKKDNISVIRTANGKSVRLKVNYEDLAEGKKLEQNIELKPGDQIIVPE